MITRIAKQTLASLIVLLLSLPPGVIAQQDVSAPALKQEELDQLLAPIALYPDSLISQILMASTYPLEVVQAERFAAQNKNLKGDALTKVLEQQRWDPSVKSLVNFPQVLTMMSEKLDWTQKLGDAFLAQQNAVMETIQNLRVKAKASGNLKTTNEQKVIVEEKIIKIEPASPQIIYVPTYNPTVVYGAWPYPAYPPYYYYPPGYVAATSAFAFASGVALGAAWGYAWGNCNWHGGNIDIDVNHNYNFNRNINRQDYIHNLKDGQGNWQHDPNHRKGVPYQNEATAQKYNRGTANQEAKAREAYRGRAEQGRQELAGGGIGDRGGLGDRRSPSQLGGGGGERGGFGNRGGALDGIERGGGSARTFSERGSASRGSLGGGARPSGFGGGGRAGRR
jgi:uncharacterized protein DUF3300